MVLPEIKIVGCGSCGHFQKSRNHRNDGFEGPHINKLKSYKFKLKQNKTTELSNVLFPEIHHNKLLKISQVFPGFLWDSHRPHFWANIVDTGLRIF